MAYSTPQLVRMAAVPSSDGNQTSGTGTAADLSDAELTDLISEADSTIDAMIGKYYSVPVAVVITGETDGDGSPVGSVPHPIDYWSRGIALYNATLSIRQGLDFADTDPVARRYTMINAQLTAVSKGQANLQLPDNTSGPSGTGAGMPVNQYVGDLFDPRDWSLRPLGTGWPLWPDIPAGGGNW